MQRLIEDTEAEVAIELSSAKIRFSIGDVVLTSKLIDGAFPDYGRVIPAATTRNWSSTRRTSKAAVDRVSTVSSERGRAVKLPLASGKLILSVTNPDSGSATEETRGRVRRRARSISASTRATCSTSRPDSKARSRCSSWPIPARLR